VAQGIVESSVLRGCCHLYYALDIGFAVDLKRCTELIQEAREAGGVQRHGRAPHYLNLRPPPVCISQAAEPIQGTTFRTDGRITLKVYDFGAVSVEYRIPFEKTLDQLAVLSAELYDDKRFAADARARSEMLLRAISSAVRRPQVREEAEDYLIFEIPELGDAGLDLDTFLGDQGSSLARILSSNTASLSGQQQREELAGRIAYYGDDLTIITWNAALVFGKDMDDVLTVLELANVQLRELHYLDDRLDDSLRAAYDMSAQAAGARAQMRHIRELMLDGQAFSEAVTNAFKPFADVFLARVYAQASASLGLENFDRSIKDKLNLLHTLYTTLADEADHEKSVRLEWIVIILIAIEIVMGLSEKILPWLRGQ
jgi:hypothetical protein